MIFNLKFSVTGQTIKIQQGQVEFSFLIGFFFKVFEKFQFYEVLSVTPFLSFGCFFVHFATSSDIKIFVRHFAKILIKTQQGCVGVQEGPYRQTIMVAVRARKSTKFCNIFCPSK